MPPEAVPNTGEEPLCAYVYSFLCQASEAAAEAAAAVEEIMKVRSRLFRSVREERHHHRTGRCAARPNLKANDQFGSACPEPGPAVEESRERSEVWGRGQWR